MKSKEEIKDLKEQWHSDPSWDIEDTEGFEAHRAELKEYRLKCEAEWEQKRVLHRAELAGKICPVMSAGQPIFCRCQLEECTLWDKLNECCALKSVILK